MNWFNLAKNGGLVAFAAALIACNSQGKPPTSGQAKLDYISTSESIGVFNLENRTAQTLKINGSGNSQTGIDVYLGEYSLSCTKANKSDEDPDGSSDPPEFAEIKPGERALLRVHTKLTQRYKGGRCELWLTAFRGKTDSIGSGEFVP
jgi:hypothetical protein